MREKSAKSATRSVSSRKKTAKKSAGAPERKSAAATGKKGAAPKKKTAATAKKKAAATPKKKAAATPKKKIAANPKKKIAATPKKKTAATPKKKTAAPTASAPHPAPEPPEGVPSSRPSQRAMAVASQLPQHERALTDEEREAMTKVAHTALAELAIDGVPEVVVDGIGRFVDEVRSAARSAPTSQDVRLGLGVLWGEQVRAQVGWRWVHLSYPNGFASYALVPDDRAFACFPLNRMSELLAGAINTSVPLFNAIRLGLLPARQANAYLVIG